MQVNLSLSCEHLHEWSNTPDWDRYSGRSHGAENACVDAEAENVVGLSHPIEFESDVIRRNVPWLTADPISSVNFTPIHALEGTITPQGCAFERHHAGAIELAKPDYRLMINGLVDRMAELSRTLLSFARKPGQATGAVHLGTVIEEALLLARPRARKAGVEIRLSGEIDTMTVSGGRVRLGQVFVNLVNNAVDAIGERPGGVVEIVAKRGENLAIVEVSDNGPGIPEQALDHIFDPFFTTKATGEGIGIGLSIVDNIVRDFGGKVSAHNGENGGAVFRVELLPADAKAMADV